MQHGRIAPGGTNTKIMQLCDLLGHYMLARPTAPKQKSNLIATMRKLDAFLGRPAVIGDLTDTTVNGLLAGLAGGSLSRWTIKGHRSRLLALWRFAAEDGLIERLPRKVRSVAVPAAQVEGYCEDQLARLLAACDRIPGRFKNKWRVPRRDFGRAMVLAAYDMGARLGDLERLPVSAINDTVVWFTQHKTGKEHQSILRPETIAAIRLILSPDRPTIFGGVVNRKNFYRFWRGLVKSAGLTGSFRWIRRTSGSLVEAASPGNGCRHLGNRPDVFRRHYEIKRLTNAIENRPSPPPIRPAPSMETVVTFPPITL
jgi:hypothetical protein